MLVVTDSIFYFNKNVVSNWWIFWTIKQKVNIIVNIEVTNRTNSITSRNLVIPACFDIKFMITYSKVHKCFSIRIFSSNIKINRWCIAVFKNIIKFKLFWVAKRAFPVGKTVYVNESQSSLLNLQTTPYSKLTYRMIVYLQMINN